jgi:hypothetical protein
MTFKYRWLRCERSGLCSSLLGATGATFRLTSREVGRTIRVRVTATNSKGSAAATSAARAAVKRYGVATTRARDARGIRPGRFP